jgi:type I restriction enzyme S subunit
MMEATYPAHETYKPSGYDWVGTVPSHWAVEKLGTSLRAVSEKNRPDLPLLSITREKGVIERDLDDDESNHNFIPDDLSGYKVLRAGQFGMNKMKAWQGSYGVSQHTGIVSPAYFIFDFTKEIDPDFFNRAIRSKLYVSFFGSASDGVRIGQWDLNKARMREIPLLVPPLPEQRAIAAFLDDKCAKIDGAVKIKEEQIALLRERRQIIIQDAVTRGLNPTAPMKDSGIDWIGQIPAHWDVVRFKYLFTQSRLPVQDDDEIVTSYRDGQVTLRSNRRLDGYTEAIIEGGYQGIRPGQLVLNSMDAFEGAIGVSDSAGKCTPEYVICDPNNSKINQYYFSYLLREMALAKYIQVICNAVRQRAVRIRFNNLATRFLVVPPLEEQKEIVDFIDAQKVKITEAIAIKELQIAALKEYKTSLINAAVTGKIKVI